MPSHAASKRFLLSLVSLVVAVTLSFAAGEALLRLKNASMKNYDIEMWRYGQMLSRPSADPLIGHEQVPNANAVLESVTIRTNAWGLRGGPIDEKPPAGSRRIIVLGSSIALGWGVEEGKTVSALLQQKFEAAHQEVEVLNAGVADYNTQRYVERFLQALTPLQPSDVLILAFVRDGEELGPSHRNFLLGNSELALTIWIAAQRLLEPGGQDSLIEHYRAVYAPGSPARKIMEDEFAKLAAYAHGHGVRVTLAMIPDVHILKDYPLGFVDDVFAGEARSLGFAYVDLLPVFRGLTPEEIWAMPGDPHPNARGHALMAGAIFPVLAAEAPATAGN